VTIDNNRLLLELEQTRRKINRGVINPEIKTLSHKEIEPIITMVADARADYVAELFKLAAKHDGKKPDETTRLRELRQNFEELVAASNALETMIKRGYVDVQGKPGRG